ncbi:MAG: protein phosphatase 2C domain-containing protein [Planctomycetales bacterium]|nr:protein phosphatase 2C domain-containing protein [Planctomycetales bacterium]
MLIRRHQRAKTFVRGLVSRPSVRADARSVLSPNGAVNENFVFCEPAAAIFSVAAGIGRGLGGSEAAEFATSVVAGELMEAQIDCSFDQFQAASILRRAKGIAMDGLCEFARACPEVASMGTSLALGWIVHGQMHFAHIGACSIFQLRQQTMTRMMSRDTTCLDREIVYPARYLGPTSPDSRLTVTTVELEVGDRFVLLTDTVLNGLSEQSLENALRIAKDPAEACDWVTTASQCSDSSTDKTCLVVEISEPG